MFQRYWQRKKVKTSEFSTGIWFSMTQIVLIFRLSCIKVYLHNKYLKTKDLTNLSTLCVVLKDSFNEKTHLV